MLLENIFAAAVFAFIFLIALGLLLDFSNRFQYSSYCSYINTALLASGTVTIITAVLWIVRAWG